MQRRAILLTVPGLLAAPAVLRAQPSPWPNGPVRIVNPFAPGGTSDIIIRPLAERLERAFGRPFIIDNRAGAGGTVGAAAAAGARPDGQTLLIANTGPLAVAPSVFPNLAYDPARSFAYVALLGGAPIVCAVKGGDGPLRSMSDYLAAARRGADAVSYGSSGVGSVGHLTGVLFGLEAGVRLLHVPFRGAPEAQQSVLSGDTASLWDTSGANAAAIRAGQMRGLAVSSAERVPALPDVPSLRESGFPGVVATNWFALAAPAGLDPEIVARLNAAARDALADPAIRERLEASGVVPLGTETPAEIADFVAKERERWAPVARAAGIRPG